MNTKPMRRSSEQERTSCDWVAQAVKFTLLCFLLLFLAGRLGMLLHEFAGHALAWRLLGGRVVDFKLFVFGGGWVCGRRPFAAPDAPTLSMLFVQLSGIAVELIVGTSLALLAVSRIARRTIRRLSAATSSVLIVHALFYLVLCAYYGSGDGTALFRILHGRIREAFLVTTVGLTISAAFLVSYLFSPAMRTWVTGCRRRQALSLIVLGVFSAALLHAILTAGERIVVNDRTYAEIKTPVNVRLKEKALAGFLSAYQRKHRREPSQDRIDAVQTDLESRYGQFPIQIPLGAAVLVALIAGFFSSERRDHTPADPITWNDVGLLGGLSALVLALVLFLNRL